MRVAVGALVIVLLGYAQAQITYEDVLGAEFESFKVEHEKNYLHKYEEELRKQIFMDNKELIDRHNERYAAGEETYAMGVNQFTDLLDSEFESLMLTKFDKNELDANIDLTYVRQENNLPQRVDWRDKGAVTDVKNQKHCGSCWAFAAAGALEGAHFIKNRQLISLSEQNLVDCASKYNNHGCHGGWPGNALIYIKENGGINSNKIYPYEAVDGQCRFKKDAIAAKVHEVFAVEKNEQTLATAVTLKGPIAVAVDAHLFRHYKDGIFNNKDCNKPVSHAVLLIGYGPDYWLIKNSWGTVWGEKGYMRLARNQNNMCHVASHAVFADVP